MKSSIELTNDVRIARTDGLVTSEVDGEVVILSIESGHFFQLNGIGSRIWDMLETPMTVETICATMRDGFAVDADECRRDVTDFVQKMGEKGLVQSA